MKPKVAILGSGGIGIHLAKRIKEEKGWSLVFSGSRKTFAHKEHPPVALMNNLFPMAPELVFLCISTLDKGEAAKDYIAACVASDIKVVTCEKGALAYHAKELAWTLPKLGFSAAVGGGTHMLRYLAERRPNGRAMDIDGVLNGTLNFVFHQVAEGSTLGEACADAKRLGYAEPGADDPLSLINGEMRDVVMKACVFFNTTLSSGEYLTPEDFGPTNIDAIQLKTLSKVASSYRMVVSLSNRSPISKTNFFNEGFGAEVGVWNIRAGFRFVHNDAEFDWLPGGVGNGLCVTEGELGSGGKYVLLGPGAGYEPTTTAMLNDAERLLGL